MRYNPKQRLIGALHMMMLLMVLLPPFYTVYISAPVIEGKYFPVVNEAYLTHISPLIVEDTNETVFSRVWGEADKLRDCHYRRMFWYLGKRGEALNAEITVHIEETSKLRYPGKFTFGPWLHHVHWKHLTERNKQVHADVYHQCHTFGIPHPWLTRSRLYG